MKNLKKIALFTFTLVTLNTKAIADGNGPSNSSLRGCSKVHKFINRNKNLELKVNGQLPFYMSTIGLDFEDRELTSSDLEAYLGTLKIESQSSEKFYRERLNDYSNYVLDGETFQFSKDIQQIAIDSGINNPNETLKKYQEIVYMNLTGYGALVDLAMDYHNTPSRAIYRGENSINIKGVTQDEVEDAIDESWELIEEIWKITKPEEFISDDQTKEISNSTREERVKMLHKAFQNFSEKISSPSKISLTLQELLKRGKEKVLSEKFYTTNWTRQKTDIELLIEFSKKSKGKIGDIETLIEELKGPNAEEYDYLFLDDNKVPYNLVFKEALIDTNLDDQIGRVKTCVFGIENYMGEAPFQPQYLVDLVSDENGSTLSLKTLNYMQWGNFYIKGK